MRSESSGVRRWLAVAVVFGLPGLQADGRGQEIIDRMLAVVNGEVVTLSDVRGYLHLGLVVSPAEGDPIDAALSQLLERELVLAEVERYPPDEPTRAEVAERLDAVKRRFPDEPFADALRVAGMSEQRLEDILRDQIRIERYLAQRFGAVAQPTDQEVARYYEDHQDRFVRAGELAPYGEVRDDIRRVLQTEQRRALIESWVDSLRRRASVQILYLPERQPDPDP